VNTAPEQNAALRRAKKAQALQNGPADGERKVRKETMGRAAKSRSREGIEVRRYPLKSREWVSFPGSEMDQSFKDLFQVFAALRIFSLRALR
jgi:hypothetical protein